MDRNLCTALIEKNLICKGTKLLVTIKRIGINVVSSEKQINLVVESFEGSGSHTGYIADWIFTCINLDTKERYTEIIPSQILDVDGMVPDRLGKIFNINPDGTLRAPGKKRGRKSKK